MKDPQLDALVAAVTREVQARLANPSAPPRPAPDPEGCSVPGRTTPCHATKDSCTNHGHCLVRKPEVVEKMVAEGASRIGAGPGMARPDSALAAMIDHTLLKPDATRDQLVKVCEEARQYHFATVCVNSANIPLVASLLKGSGVKPIAVVGFPLGAASTASKAFEAREAVRQGALEIDMVLNIGALKSRDYKMVQEDIAKVVEASRPHKVKVILETSMLSDEEKVIASVLSKAGGAHFVKTSTGFGGGGATVADIQLMRRVVGTDMEVKASGGIRTRQDADTMVAAGADRIGASASVSIVTGATDKKTSGY